eukprot:4837842-Pyramimonas_sp.AAC.1
MIGSLLGVMLDELPGGVQRALPRGVDVGEHLEHVHAPVVDLHLRLRGRRGSRGGPEGVSRESSRGV